MKTVILYASLYGSSRRYAEAFGVRTGWPVRDFRRTDSLADYDRVIYFGGVYAGTVTGLKQTAGRLADRTRLVICTVGLVSPERVQGVAHIREGIRRQVPEPVFRRTVHYHLRGGIDYQKLTFRHRMMMRALCAVLRRKPAEKQTEDDRLLLRTCNQKADLVDLQALDPIVQAVQ